MTLAFLGITVGIPSTAAAASPPLLSFDLDGIVATGVTPRGKVAWFGVGHAHEEAALHILSRYGFVADEDGDGEVRFEIKTDVPRHSVWIAVDMESGELAVGAPEGHELRRLELPANAIHPGAGGTADLFEDGHRMLQLVVVRPRSAGAWSVQVADAGGRDTDGEANGRVLLSLEGMTPFEESPELRPAVLTAGDVLAAIALDSLETYAVKLPAGGQKP